MHQMCVVHSEIFSPYQLPHFLSRPPTPSSSLYISTLASPIFLSPLHLLSVLLHPALAVRVTVISVMSSKGKCGGWGGRVEIE